MANKISKRVMDAINVIKGRLHSVKRNCFSTPRERGEEAAKLADELLRLSVEEMTREEKKEYKLLKGLIEDPKAKAFLVSLTDQAFRSNSPRRVAKTIRGLIYRFGIPKSFSFSERLAFRLFNRFSPFAPFLFVPFMKQFARAQAAKVILPGERKELAMHLALRRQEGVQINLNRLGEAILGEEEAQNRLDTYLEDLESPDINYISVKLSALFSQIQVVDFEGSAAEVEKCLRTLYRSALEHHKFVNLDMEEWKDVELTLEVFKKVLDEKEFLSLTAGIVIQSYLPVASSLLRDLITWAKARVKKGGAPIKVRLVKGANLGMERIEASLKGWPQATFETKIETDAEFIRLLHLALKKDHSSYLQVGVGSHNLFDISYALLLRAEEGLEKTVVFEMLEGMGRPERRIIQEVAGGILLYCPVAKKEDFHSAFSYLIRRFDENTGRNHFLRTLFTLGEDRSGWEIEKRRFLLSLSKIDDLDLRPKRVQNRFEHTRPTGGSFINEPDTDFTVPENRKWVESHLALFLKEGVKEIPSLIGGKVIEEGRDKLSCFDPSFPGRPLYAVLLATVADGEKAVKAATAACAAWAALSLEERSKILLRVTQILRHKRGELIAALVADGAKTVHEADAEISEAIDFGEYYIRSSLDWHSLPSLRFAPKGVVFIASPWNFPLSIPSGGIFAALMEGNGVIFKPSLETPLVGWRLAHCFWEGGVPRELLAFVVGQDATLGSSLVQNESISMAVLTGSTETARFLLNLRPGLDLAAETGGKNSMIVTAMADRDLAVRDIVHSAFAQAGQKCSALSLLILEDEVYRDKRFREQLLDAARSLKAGSPWNLSTRVPPLIGSPSEHLKRALHTLDVGEEWLLKPERDGENPHLYSPGIKLGVKEGSFTHQTELFGPLLAVMRAKNLDHAISIANATPYGLTAGLHSLDLTEQEYWRTRIRAGNLYINRTITGAIVGRQPFGGCKASQFGLGAKAGGPNYVALFSKIGENGTPLEKEPLSPPLESLLKYFNTLPVSVDEKELFEASLGNYQFWWNRHFGRTEDLTKLLGQKNFYYYVPHHLLVLRVEEGDKLVDVFRSIALCHLASAPYELSIGESLKPFFSDLALLRPRELYVETASQFLERMKKGSSQRVRKFSPPDKELVKVFARAGTYLSSEPVVATGRWEFLYHVREISLSCETHRYGNLGFEEEDVAHESSEGKSALV